MAVQDLGKGVKLYTRNEWGARKPRSMSENKALREVFIHHTTNAAAESVDRLAEQKAAMRATQAFHMDVRGWADIGYAYVVFQPFGSLTEARIMQGRETEFVPAAQENHNSGTVPICIYGNFQKDDKVRPETLEAIIQLVKWIEKFHSGSLTTIGGHRDVGQTTCPGDSLYAHIPTLARATGLRRF